jgi:hypothetical protein
LLLCAPPSHEQIHGSFEVLKGPPADTKASISAALCRQTKADGAAAIVIGSASRGGLKEALLGSIAANLAHNCDVPVVVLHKPGAEAVAGRMAGNGQHRPGDVTWLFRASTQEILGEAAAEQLDPAGEQVRLFDVCRFKRPLFVLWQPALHAHVTCMCHFIETPMCMDPVFPLSCSAAASCRAAAQPCCGCLNDSKKGLGAVGWLLQPL